MPSMTPSHPGYSLAFPFTPQTLSRLFFTSAHESCCGLRPHEAVWAFSYQLFAAAPGGRTSWFHFMDEDGRLRVMKESLPVRSMANKQEDWTSHRGLLESRGKFSTIALQFFFLRDRLKSWYSPEFCVWLLFLFCSVPAGAHPQLSSFKLCAIFSRNLSSVPPLQLVPTLSPFARATLT